MYQIYPTNTLDESHTPALVDRGFLGESGPSIQLSADKELTPLSVLVALIKFLGLAKNNVCIYVLLSQTFQKIGLQAQGSGVYEEKQLPHNGINLKRKYK